MADIQYMTLVRYPTDGVTTHWAFSFAGGYLDRQHVKAALVDAESGRFDPVEFQWVDNYQIMIEPALAAGQTLEIYRDTYKVLPLVDYTDGSILNETNLNRNARQAIYSVAELVDRFQDTDVLASVSALIAREAAGRAEDAAERAEAAADDAALLRSELANAEKGTRLIAYGNGTLEKRLKRVVYADIDFGVQVDNDVDQTDKMKQFTDWLRDNPGSVGVLPVGTITVSAKYTKVVAGQTDTYAVDISGCHIVGSGKGYRGRSGSRIKMVGTPGIMLYQAQTGTANTKCILSYISAYGDVSKVLHITYAIHNEITGLTWEGNIHNAITVGDRRLAAGALSNIFTACTGAATTGPALILEGMDWVNGNTFTKCYFSGLVPSTIDCDGGYGAVSNLFIGTEFASPVGGGAGIIIGRSMGTTFLNGYFEARGPSAILLPRAIAVSFDQCTFAVTTAVNPYGQACFIYHQGSGALSTSVTINGGWVSTNSGDDYADMAFIDGNGASPIDVTINTQPNLQVQGPRFQIMRDSFLRSVRSLRGSYSQYVTPQFSASSPGLTLGSGSLVGRVSISGRRVNYRVMLTKGADTVFSNNNQINLVAPSPMIFSSSMPDYVGDVRIQYPVTGDLVVIRGDSQATAAASPGTITLRRPAVSSDYGIRMLVLRGTWVNDLPAGSRIVVDFNYEN